MMTDDDRRDVEKMDFTCKGPRVDEWLADHGLAKGLVAAGY